MEKITVMRWLRISHGISLKELADAADVSPQYISSVELGNIHFKNLNKRMQKAFETLITAKGDKLDALGKAYDENRDRLLEDI